MPFTVHVTLIVTMLQKETPRVYPSRDVDVQFVRFESGGLSGVCERVYRSQIHDVKYLKERLLREWRLLDHTIIAAAIAKWRSRLNANGVGPAYFKAASTRSSSSREWWTF